MTDKAKIAFAVIGSVIVVALVSFVAACGQAEKQDADTTRRSDVDRSRPLKVVAMPDNFANVVIKCDGLGNLIYVTSHAEEKPPQLLVIPDKREVCR